MHDPNPCVSAQTRSRCFWVNCLLLLSGLILPGCSAEHKAAMRQGSFTRVVTPEPPPFLTGSASLLLTNRGSFSARVEIQAETSLGTERTSSGQLLGNGAKLLYAPEEDPAPDPHGQRGGYSFIWDVALGRGYVLSEALQGYAPVIADLQVTNVQTGAGKSPAQRISGHPCESVINTAQMKDGSSIELETLRAMDLHGFPLRIQTQGKGPAFTLLASKLRFEALSPEVFGPPESFTQYPNPQAMADELAARQHNLKRRNAGQMPVLPELEPRRY